MTFEETLRVMAIVLGGVLMLGIVIMEMSTNRSLGCLSVLIFLVGMGFATFGLTGSSWLTS